MTQFRCLVLTADGRTDWRTVDAAETSAAISSLVAAGVTPLEIRSGTPTLIERLNQPVRFGWLRLREQALILTQLATLVRSGLPVDRSLDLIREQSTRARPRQLLTQAVAQVRSGESLAATFEQLGAFPGYVIGILRAAERGGHLGDALGSVAGRLNASAAARQQLITALTYPVAVLIATVAALFIVLTQVVPQFAPIFEGEEDRLPTLTRLVLALSNFTGEHAGLMIGTVALAICAAVLLWRSPPALVANPHIRSRIPGLALRDQYLAGQFIGILGTLVQNGVPAPAALPLARGALGSATWRQSLEIVERQVREGVRLSSAFARTSLLPSAAVRLIEVGERSGALAEACGHASEVILQAAAARLDRVISLANPIAIVILGGLVGSLVAGVMLGIFALGDFAG
jgi:type II secretory pathway component PulF